MKDFDLSFIMAMAAGGDTANEAFEHKLREFTREHGVKYPLAQGYGMSETSSAAAFGVFNIHRDGSAGVPCIHTIISTFKPGTTEELDIGEMGEICITGPILMKEYLGEPEETSQVMWEHPDGRIWVHSGDVGYIDEDGFLFIKGRMKRSIIRFDGHKVYPLQIEEVVSSHPEIRKCVVTGVRDLSHEQGELPMIFAEIEIRDDGDEEALRGEIMSLCRERLEERGQPSGVIFVDKLPVTNGGKIDIQKLTEVYHEKQQDQ
jgi:long-chain acyl-CoA synthetase